MTKITEADAVRADRLSEWAESDDFAISSDATIVRGEGNTPGRSLLEAAVGAEETDRIANLGGRPSLSGAPGEGASPKRQVRLPRALDVLLVERAQADHQRPSDIMRAALVAYLTPEEGDTTAQRAS